MKVNKTRKMIKQDELIFKEEVLAEASGGEIVGQYRNIINVRLDSGEGISLTSPGVSMAPYHMQISTFPAELNLQGKSIIIFSGKILLPDDSKIIFGQGKMASSQLEPNDQLAREARQNLTDNLKLIYQYFMGRSKHNLLQVLRNEKNYEQNNNADNFTRYLGSLILQLQQAETWEKKNIVLRKFLGAGRGLTPAGDDFLVGLLSLLYYYDRQLAAKINLELQHKDQSSTTLVSFMALKAAMRGHFNQEILNFYDSLTNTTGELFSALKKLLNMGSSSGEDILAGILFAANFLVRPRLLNKNMIKKI